MCWHRCAMLSFRRRFNPFGDGGSERVAPGQIRETSNGFGYAAFVNGLTAIAVIEAWRNHTMIQEMGAQPLQELQ